GESGADRGLWPGGYAVSTVRDAQRDGRRVFAFAGGATFFATQGVRFERSPIPVQPVEEWIAAQPAGTTLLIAAAHVNVPLEWSGIDRRDPRGLGLPRPYSVFIRRIGDPSVERRLDDDNVSMAPRTRPDA